MIRRALTAIAVASLCIGSQAAVGDSTRTILDAARATNLHTTKITTTSISLAWSAPRGATFVLRRTVGNRPPKSRHGGVPVTVHHRSARDRHLHAGTHYAYALFTRMQDRWRPAVTLRAVTRSPAHKTTPATIDEYGVGGDLECTLVDNADNPPSEFFDDSGDSACGTFVDVKGTTYGPADIPNGDHLKDNETYRAWDGTAQTTGGTGTRADPYMTTTTAAAPASPLTISQTDRYVAGESDVSTTTTVTNTSDSDVSITLYHAFDCFAGGTDRGTGASDPSTGAVSCLSSKVRADGGRRTLQLTPTTSGSHFVEEFYQDLWSDIAAQHEFTDSVRTDVHDTAAGLSWTVTVPANDSVSVEYTTALLNSF